MDYEIVTLKQMHVAGLSARTSNGDSDMRNKIGGLWQQLYGDCAVLGIPGRTGGSTYGVYTGYESDVHGAYDVVAGAAVSTPEAPWGELTIVTIPAGKYAKFSATVNIQDGGVGNLWQNIWNMGLNRAYTADFEEYPPCEDMTKAPVNLYIALAE